ncbi:MAG: carbohydrate-binding domain-containing protein, partial [Clostridia bacterium]
MFTPRDKESGYDESTGTKITLNGEGATANSEAVKIVGKTVTLSDEGVYIISGSLKNGQIIVDADKTAITSADSAPLYIKQADKVFVTLAADSKNTLITDGDFKEKDGNNLDSVIYSKEDLTMNGKGTISVSTKYGHGITSKDDLAITGGAYDINVSNNGLAGKNSVRIADGTFKITSGKDGVHSENADDASLGYVYIAGGIFSISGGDDGIHAGENTTINGGTIDITKSEEGIEGESIDIAGGKICLVAADDGLNAASSASASADVEKKPGHGDFAADDRCYIKISGGTLYA